VIAVIIHWEHADWVYRHKAAARKVLKLYTHTMKAFGVSKLIVVDVDEAEPAIIDAEITCAMFASWQEAVASLEGFAPVFVEDLPRAQNLAAFRHPAGDACYIIGSDYGKLTPPAGGTVVRIPTRIPLWSHVAMAIVLNDRRQKERWC